MARINVAQLRRLIPLDTLAAERLEDLATYSRSERLAPGGRPARFPPLPGQSLYLLQGELRLEYGDGSSAVIVAGSPDAAWALDRQEPRPRTLTALGPVELLTVDERLLDLLLTWDQLATNAGLPAAAGGAAEGDESTDWRMLSGAFNVQVLTASALGQLPPAHIDLLLQRFSRLRLPAGERVIREGDAGDAYYLIESGSCEVSRRIAGEEVVLAVLQAGQAFGEEALVADARRNASVTMQTRGTLLKLGKADFDTLLRQPLLKGIGRDEADARTARGQARWIDVRYPAEFRCDGLPGALNLPLGELRESFAGLDPQGEYIVYCQSGRRSSAAAFLLSQQGFNARWLDGGLWGPLAPTKDPS